jgi:hypothetical protein
VSVARIRALVYDPGVPQPSNDATRFLTAAAEGDKAAVDALLPLVYDN